MNVLIDYLKSPIMKNTFSAALLFICAATATAQNHSVQMNNASAQVAITNYSAVQSVQSSNEIHGATPVQHINAANTQAVAMSAHPASNTPVYAEHSYRPSGTSATYNPGASHSTATAISLPQRYNHITKQDLPYYSTIVTKHKSHSHVAPNSSRRHREHFLAPPSNTADYFLFYACEYFYENYSGNDVVTFTDATPTGNSIYNGSFDGYVVYGKDTFAGVITPAKNIIVLEEQLDELHELAGVYSYDDKKLKTVAIFDGNRELYLTRAVPGGKLLRTIHSGKLSLYDDHYNFLSLSNVSKTKLTLVYNGAAISSKIFLAGANKQLITDYMNKAYGLKLSANEFNWDKLLLYIDKLN